MVLVDHHAKRMGRAAHLEARPAFDPDIALAAHLLGWKPSLTVEEGIAHALAWYERRDTVLQRRP
ncbi:hypothetical protein ACIBG6_04790 [Streptomyces sp. NPDC050842]|uniref:hypothetical protein n=1 Tax=Streptomyces sp. NPDC050842 TaxID=3365636 RepID=UPI0037ACB567